MNYLHFMGNGVGQYFVNLITNSVNIEDICRFNTFSTVFEKNLNKIFCCIYKLTSEEFVVFYMFSEMQTQSVAKTTEKC